MDSYHKVTCTFCEREFEIPDGGIPGFWEDDSETERDAPVCNFCVTTQLKFNETTGDYELVGIPPSA